MVCKNLDEFENRWKDLCKKIEGQEFTREQAKTIVEDFHNEFNLFIVICKEIKDSNSMILSLSELTTTINVSLQISISNYEKRHKMGFIEKILGKPEVSIDFNAIKNKL